MGLDAFVQCRCWQDGLAAAPPFDPDLIFVDDEGHLDISVPWAGNEELFKQFFEWEKHGCAHEDMKAAGEFVASWPRYQRFRDALDRIGWRHFPVLEAELPSTNGGNTAPDRSAAALAELGRFAASPSLGRNAYLVDEDTGRELRSSIAGYEGLFALGPGYGMGIDLDGFFVVDEDREVFRAHRFRQREVDDGVELDDGTHRVVVPAPAERGGAERLAVIVRDELPADYDYIAGPLTRIFRASVETGNPVMWC